MATGAVTTREPPHRIRLTGRLTVTHPSDQGGSAWQQLEGWYSDAGRTGVGFVGGAASGGLELFEFEGPAAHAGIVGQFMDLARARGMGDLVQLPCSGYSEKSAGGGLHLLYRCEETGCVKLAKTANGKGLIVVMVVTLFSLEYV